MITPSVAAERRASAASARETIMRAALWRESAACPRWARLR